MYDGAHEMALAMKFKLNQAYWQDVMVLWGAIAHIPATVGCMHVEFVMGHVMVCTPQLLHAIVQSYVYGGGKAL